MQLSQYMTVFELDDAEMARRADVDRSTISRLRTGKTCPTWKVAERLMKATDGNVTPNDFVGAGKSHSSIVQAAE